MSEITEMIREFHGNAIIKGFYERPSRILNNMVNDGYSDEDIKAVKDAFIAQRLMLITSELGEALESNRENKYAKIDLFNKNISLGGEFKTNFEHQIKDSFEDELSDVFISLCDLAGWLEIDLAKNVRLKHQYNTGREVMHGGKSY